MIVTHKEGGIIEWGVERTKQRAWGQMKVVRSWWCEQTRSGWRLLRSSVKATAEPEQGMMMEARGSFWSPPSMIFHISIAECTLCPTLIFILFFVFSR